MPGFCHAVAHVLVLKAGVTRCANRTTDGKRSLYRLQETTMNVGYMIIPVILFVSGIFVSAALFSLGMKQVEGNKE